MEPLSRVEREVAQTLAASSLVSVGLVLVRAASYDSPRYMFLIWNLLLAWVPLLAAWWLVRQLKVTNWLSGPNLALTLLWLIFLPNSFYIVSDFVHLYTYTHANLLYDAVMMTSFAFNGLVLGFFSLYLVHKQLLRRLPANNAHGIVGAVLLLCSFAIYLGRYLRWNSWDVLFSPAGLLFDVSDRLINPNSRTFSTTLVFFLLLTSLYMVAWRLIAVARRAR